MPCFREKRKRRDCAKTKVQAQGKILFSTAAWWCSGPNVHVYLTQISVASGVCTLFASALLAARLSTDERLAQLQGAIDRGRTREQELSHRICVMEETQKVFEHRHETSVANLQMAASEVQQLRAEKARNFEQVKSEKNMLARAHEEQREQLGDLETQLRHTQQRLDEKLLVVNALECTQVKRETDLKISLHALETATGVTKELQSSLARATVRMQAQEEQRERLSGALDEERVQHFNTITALGTAQDEVTRLKLMLQTSSTKERNTEALAKARDELATRLSAQYAKLIEVTADRDAALAKQSEAEKEKLSLDMEKAQLTARVELETSAVKQVKEKLESLVLQYRTAKSEADALRQENARLKASLNAKPSVTAEVTERLSTLQREVQAKEEALAKEVSRRSATERTLEETRRDRVTGAKQDKSRIAALEAEVQSHLEQRKTALLEVERCKGIANTHVRKAWDLGVELDAKNADLDSLKKQFTSQLEQLQSLSDERCAAVSERSELATQLHTTEIVLKTTTTKLDVLSTTVRTLEATRSATETAMTERNGMIEALQTEVKEQGEALEQVRQDLEETMAERDTLVIEVQRFTAERSMAHGGDGNLRPTIAHGVGTVASSVAKAGSHSMAQSSYRSNTTIAEDRSVVASSSSSAARPTVCARGPMPQQPTAPHNEMGRPTSLEFQRRQAPSESPASAPPGGDIRGWPPGTR